MPLKSPFTTTFKTLVTRGTPCWTAVTTIAARFGKTPNFIFRSLYGAGLVTRQKVSGQWVYWPTFPVRTSTTFKKVSTGNLWQAFIDWCICSGFCTPRTFTSHKGSEQAFIKYFARFWSKQFPGTGSFIGWSSPSFGRPGTSFKKSRTRKSGRRIARRRRTTRAHRTRVSARRRTRISARRRTVKRTGSVKRYGKRRTIKRWGTAKRYGKRRTTKRVGTTKRYGKRRSIKRTSTRTTTFWSKRRTTRKPRRTWSTRGVTSYKISRYRKTGVRRYRRAA